MKFIFYFHLSLKSLKTVELWCHKGHTRIVQCGVCAFLLCLGSFLAGTLFFFLAHHAEVRGYSQWSYCISVEGLLGSVMNWWLVLVVTLELKTAGAGTPQNPSNSWAKEKLWLVLFNVGKRREKIGRWRCEHVLFSPKGRSRLSALPQLGDEHLMACLHFLQD